MDRVHGRSPGRWGADAVAAGATDARGAGSRAAANRWSMRAQAFPRATLRRCAVVAVPVVEPQAADDVVARAREVPRLGD